MPHGTEFVQPRDAHRAAPAPGWPEVKHAGALRTVPGTLVAPVLRGLAQVDFMPGAWCGAIFAVALFTAGWQYGVFALIGTAVSTLTAVVWGVDRTRVVTGLEGFNGALVGTAAAVFLDPGFVSTWLAAVAGAIASTVLTAALVGLFGPRGITTMTFPFCVTVSAVTIGAPRFQHLWHGRGTSAALGTPAQGATDLGWTDLWHAFFANVAEIFFMPQWYVGVIFLVGIFVASWQAGLIASFGSVVAIATAWVLGAPSDDVRTGLVGYNAVLVALALCGVFISVTAWSLAYAALGAVCSTVVNGALIDMFAPVGGHTLTWPYCLTTLVFLLAVPAFPRLTRVT